MAHPRLLTPLLAPLLLAGCLATHEERVRIRRDPDLIEQEEQRVRPDAYEDFLRRRQEEQERLALTPELTREANHYAVTRKGVSATMVGIPEDPFGAYEDDRIAVLHRNWADGEQPPPEPERMLLEPAAADAAAAPAEGEEAGAPAEGEPEAPAEGGDEDEDEEGDGW